MTKFICPTCNGDGWVRTAKHRWPCIDCPTGRAHHPRRTSNITHGVTLSEYRRVMSDATHALTDQPFDRPKVVKPSER